MSDSWDGEIAGMTLDEWMGNLAGSKVIWSHGCGCEGKGGHGRDLYMQFLGIPKPRGGMGFSSRFQLTANQISFRRCPNHTRAARHSCTSATEGHHFHTLAGYRELRDFISRRERGTDSGPIRGG